MRLKGCRGLAPVEPVQALAACSDHELSDARRVGPSRRIHLGEALVQVVVPHQYDVRVVVVQRRPQGENA